MIGRLILLVCTALLTVSADIFTKAFPHRMVVLHHAHVPALILVLVGAFLIMLGVRYSSTLAIGSGLMVGGLCGNGGQLVLFGYASDWIQLGDWLTNVADIADALGLVCCCAGYARILQVRYATGEEHLT
jgi:hypothetical protein